ncbi:MAG: DHH family phosphoesterase, partial [Flavobacteriales bacterium]
MRTDRYPWKKSSPCGGDFFLCARWFAILQTSSVTSSTPASSIAALRDLLGTPRRVAIVTHHNPDGDAVGSSLGLMHIMRAAGHAVQVLLPNAPPAFLQWMPGYADAIVHETDKARASDAIAQCEVLFCLDFNRLDRVEKMQELLKTAPLKVLIDHHREPDVFDISFSDIGACATSQMVFDIAEAMGWSAHLSAQAATCLYTGIMTDSGSFRYSSTTAHTHTVAAALMERGAVPDAIHTAVMDDNSADRIKLLG